MTTALHTHGVIPSAGAVGMPVFTHALVGTLSDAAVNIVGTIVLCDDPDPLLLAILTFASSPTTHEVGESVVTPGFTATYDNGPPLVATLKDDDGNPDQDVTSTPTAFASVNTYAKTANNATVVHTLEVSDASGTDSQGLTRRWRPLVFAGADAPVGVGNGTEAAIEALAIQQLQASRAGSYSFTVAAGQKAFYAAPTSYGTPTFQIGVFPGGFFSVGVVSVTNTHGVTQDYELFESTNPALGPIVLQVT